MRTSKEQLKTYFQTGDRPTQWQFEALIDTFYNDEDGVVITSVTKDNNDDFLIHLSNDYKITVPQAQLSGGIQEKTYQELEALKANNGLVPGASYLLTDYKTKYLLSRTSEIMEGSPEPLLLRSVATDQLDMVVKSLNHPKDIIHFDFDHNVCEDGTTSRTGKIIYREDTVKQLSTYYDWRVVKFRRYNVAGLYHHDTTKESATSYKAVIEFGVVDITRYREYYILFSDTTHDAAISLAIEKDGITQTKPLQKVGGVDLAANELGTYLKDGMALVYYSPHFDAYIVVNDEKENNAVKGHHSWEGQDFTIGNGTRLVVDGTDFKDVYTFGNQSDGGALFDIQIGKWGENYNNVVFMVDDHRTRHITVGSNSYNMTFANGINWSTTIGDDCINNMFLYDFSWNIIDNEFQRNIVARFMRYIRCEGVHFDNTYFGERGMYYITFGSRVRNNTFRFLSGRGAVIFKRAVLSCFINAIDIAGAAFDGVFVNKSTEYGINWHGFVWHGARVSSDPDTLQHFVEDRTFAMTETATLHLDYDLTAFDAADLVVRNRANGQLGKPNPIAITGNKSDGTALADLLDKLSTLGIIIDETT